MTSFLFLRAQFHGIALPSVTTKPTCHFNSFNAKDGNFVLQEEGEREVHCEVHVISWRERKINAQISVDVALNLFGTLSLIMSLADFIPNLVWSGRIPCPYPGRIQLEQKGLQRALYSHIEARVVLDLQEFINSVSIFQHFLLLLTACFIKFT